MRFDCQVGAINLCEVSKMKTEAIKAAVVRFVRDEDGLTIVEYAVAGGLITLAAVVAFQTLGTNVNTQITELGECVIADAGCGS